MSNRVVSLDLNEFFHQPQGSCNSRLGANYWQTQTLVELRPNIWLPREKLQFLWTESTVSSLYSFMWLNSHNKPHCHQLLCRICLWVYMCIHLCANSLFRMVSNQKHKNQITKAMTQIEDNRLRSMINQMRQTRQDKLVLPECVCKLFNNKTTAIMQNCKKKNQFIFSRLVLFKKKRLFETFCCRVFKSLKTETKQ